MKVSSVFTLDYSSSSISSSEIFWLLRSLRLAICFFELDRDLGLGADPNPVKELLLVLITSFAFLLILVFRLVSAFLFSFLLSDESVFNFLE